MQHMKNNSDFVPFLILVGTMMSVAVVMAIWALGGLILSLFR